MVLDILKGIGFEAFGRLGRVRQRCIKCYYISCSLFGELEGGILSTVKISLMVNRNMLKYKVNKQFENTQVRALAGVYNDGT
jgi:hypothetical protein